MKTKQQKITPELAREILKGNSKNRKIRQQRVDYLADEMKNGRWQISHQGICIATDGRVLDGQHRLLAVIQSGVQRRRAACHGAHASDTIIGAYNHMVILRRAAECHGQRAVARGW